MWLLVCSFSVFSLFETLKPHIQCDIVVYRWVCLCQNKRGMKSLQRSGVCGLSNLHTLGMMNGLQGNSLSFQHINTWLCTYYAYNILSINWCKRTGHFYPYPSTFNNTSLAICNIWNPSSINQYEKIWLKCVVSETAVYFRNHALEPLNEVEGGEYWFHLVHLSVCPSVCLPICLSVDRIVSPLYLQQYLPDPFHIYTSYQATSEGVSRVKFISKFQNLNFKFVTLTLSCFDLGSNMTQWYW